MKIHVWNSEKKKSQLIDIDVVEAMNNYKHSEEIPLFKPIEKRIKEKIGKEYKLDEYETLLDELKELALDGKILPVIDGNGKVYTQEGVIQR